MRTSSSSTTFRAIGFCGADDSVDPHELVALATKIPQVEFGVLFRPDREGQPRYASRAWVERLSQLVPPKMKLAAHLCGSRVNNVLEESPDGLAFLKQLEQWQFKRVQINATAVNGVDTSRLADCATTLTSVVQQFENLEFILQRNDETKPLWEALLALHKDALPKNVSMLVDESKGTGVLAKSWPVPPTNYEIGYAGGIGPDNVRTVVHDIQAVAPGRSVWIDMESSLRIITEDGRDMFDLDKCRRVVEAAGELGILL